MVVARAHSALPALTPAFSEAPARSFSCCKNGRDDTPMSWWKHLENRFGMPFPPAVVLSARACAMQWLNSVYSSTPDQQGGVQFSLEIAPCARWPLLQHMPGTREVGGIASEPRRRLCAGGSSFIARSGCTRGTLDSSNPPAHLPAHETAQRSLKSRQCSQVALPPPLPSLPPRFPALLPLLWRCSTFGTPPA